MSTERKEGVGEDAQVTTDADEALADPSTIAGIIALIAALIGAAVELGKHVDSLSSALQGSTANWRSCAIGICNLTERNLRNPSYWMHSGRILDYSDDAGNGHDVGVATDKLPGLLRGTVGVITYSISGTNLKLAVLWSVPFDRQLYDTWFKGAIVPEWVAADEALYNDMYFNEHRLTDGDVHKAGQYGKWSREGFTIEGNMTNAEGAQLKLTLREA